MQSELQFIITCRADEFCQSEQVIASFLSQTTLLDPHSSRSSQSLIAIRHSLPSMQGCGQSKQALKTSSTKRAPKTSSTESETEMLAYLRTNNARNLNSSWKMAATHYYNFSGLKRVQILDISKSVHRHKCWSQTFEYALKTCQCVQEDTGICKHPNAGQPACQTENRHGWVVGQTACVLCIF